MQLDLGKLRASGTNGLSLYSDQTFLWAPEFVGKSTTNKIPSYGWFSFFFYYFLIVKYTQHQIYHFNHS